MLGELWERATAWTREQISTKVQATTAASVLSSAVLSTLVVWLLGVLVWNGSAAATEVDATLALVPYPVTGAVTGALTGLSTFVAGYRTRERTNLG